MEVDSWIFFLKFSWDFQCIIYGYPSSLDNHSSMEPFQWFSKHDYKSKILSFNLTMGSFSNLFKKHSNNEYIFTYWFYDEFISILCRTQDPHNFSNWSIMGVFLSWFHVYRIMNRLYLIAYSYYYLYQLNINCGGIIKYDLYFGDLVSLLIFSNLLRMYKIVWIGMVHLWWGCLRSCIFLCIMILALKE